MGKRILECLFLHRYSGTMDGDFVIPISITYGISAAIGSLTQQQIAHYDGGVADKVCLISGLCLNGVGQLGNLYHHWLLASLRAEKPDTKVALVSAESDTLGADAAVPALQP